MKTLILSFMACLLCGCSTLVGMLSLNSASWDIGEYSRATHLLATIQEDKDCSNLIDLREQAQELYDYSHGTPHNALIALMILQLNKNVIELSNHAQPLSPVYCQDKMNILNREALLIQTKIGSKTR